MALLCASKRLKRGMWLAVLSGVILPLTVVAKIAGQDTLLQSKIIQLLTTMSPSPSIKRVVKIITPLAQLPTCADPELSVTEQNRLVGNMSVTARCDQHLQFIQINVHASGTYWIAKHPIAANQVITASDIQSHFGILDGFSTQLVFDQQQIIGQIATRVISAQQPISMDALRKQWIVKSGDQVVVSVVGQGFSVQGNGTALDNAVLGDKLRVRTRSGHIINGQAVGKDKVTLLS